MKAVDRCTNREALEFATTVDREGRACVFQGPKSQCKRIADIIQVIHIDVVIKVSLLSHFYG
jgi:hypothetical protein